MKRLRFRHDGDVVSHYLNLALSIGRCRCGFETKPCKSQRRALAALDAHARMKGTRP